MQDASDGNHPQWTSTGNRQSLFSAAFAASSEQIKSTLGQSQALKFTSQSSLPNLICFTQPHRNLKEIRLASWMISSVLAELYDLEYIWSSDSDTLVRPSTLTSAAGILSSDGRVGGLSALVQLNNGDASFVSGMAQAAFGCDSYLNRAALGSIGRSECLNGPGSMFRATALREVAFQWYCFEYPNSMGTVVSHISSALKYFSNQAQAINEDIQVTMLLAQRGWKRLYSDLSIIETGGPTTLRGWIGQRVGYYLGTSSKHELAFANRCRCAGAADSIYIVGTTSSISFLRDHCMPYTFVERLFTTSLPFSSSYTMPEQEGSCSEFQPSISSCLS